MSYTTSTDPKKKRTWDTMTAAQIMADVSAILTSTGPLTEDAAKDIRWSLSDQLVCYDAKAVLAKAQVAARMRERAQAIARAAVQAVYDASRNAPPPQMGWVSVPKPSGETPLIIRIGKPVDLLQAR